MTEEEFAGLVFGQGKDLALAKILSKARKDLGYDKLPLLEKVAREAKGTQRKGFNAGQDFLDPTRKRYREIARWLAIDQCGRVLRLHPKTESFCREIAEYSDGNSGVSDSILKILYPAKEEVKGNCHFDCPGLEKTGWMSVRAMQSIGDFSETVSNVSVACLSSVFNMCSIGTRERIIESSSRSFLLLLWRLIYIYKV